MIRITQSSSRLKQSSYTARSSMYLHRRRSLWRPIAAITKPAKAKRDLEKELEAMIKLPPRMPTPEITKRSEQFMPELRHQNFL